MKQNLFDIISKQTEEITKVAFILPALKWGASALGRLGGAALRNPMKTVGTAFTAADVAGGTQRFSSMANKNPSNPF